MISLALLLALSAAPGPADEAPSPSPTPSLVNSMYWRAALGAGTVPFVPGGHLDLTLDFGSHTFAGAFSTGISTSLATSFEGRWFAFTEGVFVQLDLVYVVMTRFWSRESPSSLPFHLELGLRIGLGASESFPSKQDTPWANPYLLVRPELRTFLDFEWPFGATRRQAWLVRLAVDTPVNLSHGYANPYRWSLSGGITWGWGDG